jgi:hypothetical protein
MVGTAAIATHADILRMSSFWATETWARLAFTYVLSSSSKAATCSTTWVR